MMIGKAANNNEDILLLGITRANVEKLIAGNLIRISRATHGEGIPEGLTIVIFFGETEREMQKQFKASGLIGPETKVKIYPRL